MPISLSGSLNLSGSLTTTGTITATTLVVQTITSSISSITGSTNFGSISANTHTFTGSVLTSGSVGIGTTPSHSLTLVGGQTTPGSFSAGNYTFGIYSGSVSTVLRETFAIGSDASYIYMQSFSSRPLYINRDGNNIILGSNAAGVNVGVGTTSPNGKLDVYAGTYQNLIFKAESANQSSLRFNESTNGPRLYSDAGTEEFRMQQSYTSTGFLSFYTGPTERMRITPTGTIISQGGNIVLGTNNNASYSSTSAYSLHIANAGSEGSVAQGQITFGEVTAYGINTNRIGAAITTVYADTYSRLGLSFKTKNTADDAGPLERLFISSAGVTTLKGPTMTSNTQSSFALAVGESGYPNLTIGYKQATAGYIQTWSSTALYLNQQGNAVYAGAVRLDTLSDERIKDNIQPISGSLNKVLQLNGKKFHLKDEPEDKIRYGFIAQDLEGILDEFVIQTDMTFTKDDLVVENVKSIENWASSWAALLVEAIKELKAENNTLKSRIEALENK